MKKAVAVLISLGMAIGLLSGCGGSKDAGESSSASGKVTTFTINSTTPNATFNTPTGKVLTEKTGLKFDYMTVIGGSDEARQKYEVWLASGDFPDVLAIDPSMTAKYRDAGAIIPLEDLIGQYGPNIKKKFGKFYELLRDPDGHIYSIFAPNLSEKVPNAQASFVVQYEVLKEAGYPEIKTFDQLHDILKDYVKKHPKLDGQDVIPFSSPDPARTYMNAPIAAAGQPDHGEFIIDKDQNVHLAVTDPLTKDFYKFLNTLNNEGMLDKELFSLTWESFSAKAAQGRILAGFVPQWIMGGIENSLTAAGKFDQLYAKFPIHINDSIEDHTNTITPTNSTNNWCITNKVKNPEKIIQFIDYLFTDEGQELTAWGIEGKHFEKKDGKRTVMEAFAKERAENPTVDAQEGYGSYSWFTFGNGSKLEEGDWATPTNPDTVEASYAPKTKEVLAKYGKQVWADFLPAPEYIPTFTWQLNAPSEYKGIWNKLEQVIYRGAARVILAENDSQFESEWNDLQQQLEKSGQKKAEELWTKTWKSYLETYNKAVQSQE
ncbi:extracellular solute-binding protein [Paenibacillus sp.]|jgi:putative aldouronate transport system substrate-binding protein|uniref:extracellular solute-binding protein n=1 Tax=Paenibacillus sp. TaxID=58172 RepID=UPI00282B583F|nr:extracellular solute-binding protein [Paenibacillus sp.]MDR0271677.1 extracellular solute-binding protein [Paenibacillus sp.]